MPSESLTSTITVAELISRLKSLADAHGGDTPVFIHDEDTDWPLPLGPDAVRLGKDDFDCGVVGAVMIRSKGYYDGAA